MNKFISPCCVYISGCSQSGKTSFVKRLLEHRDVMFSNPPKKVYYFYGVYQKLFDEIKGVEFQHGLPENYEDFADPDGGSVLLIFDDLIQSAVKNSSVERLFTQGSHHLQLSVLLISQNSFQKGSSARTISLNSSYLILFRCPRDGQVIVNLGKQIFPGRGSLLTEAYNDAMKKKYNYLVVDLSPHFDFPDWRLKTGVLPDEQFCVYRAV